mmetsp:Transcript_7449/g.8015  ORF Transcript_7449/g.8015 Transcript_7449/m.8015 type:complete len:286 (-) Transcript_7449:129-986(-)
MSYQTKTETTPLGNSSKVVGTSASLKKVVIAVLFGAAGLMYAGLDTTGTVPAADLTKRGILPHETCPYDFKFKGITLMLEFSGKEGHEDTFSCFKDVLREWRNHKGLVQFGLHATLIYGIDKSEEEHIKTLMTTEVPKYSVFDMPINFEIPTNHNYRNYTSGKGWEYADDNSMYQMRYMELTLAGTEIATELHQLFQRNLSSGGSSTPGGLFEPHISIIYANRGDSRCVTKGEHDPEDLLQVLEQHGCGLTTLSEALQVSSISLIDQDNKTADEWVKIYEIPLSK